MKWFRRTPINDDTPELAYSHPSHEVFNQRFEPTEHTPRDPAAPWLDYATLPPLLRAFHTHHHGQIQDQGPERQQDNETMIQPTQPVMQPKPPAYTRKAAEQEARHEQWLLAERDAVLEQAQTARQAAEHDYEQQPIRDGPSW